VPRMYLVDSAGSRRRNPYRNRKRFRGAIFRACREAREDGANRINPV